MNTDINQTNSSEAKTTTEKLSTKEKIALGIGCFSFSLFLLIVFLIPTPTARHDLASMSLLVLGLFLITQVFVGFKYEENTKLAGTILNITIEILIVFFFPTNEQKQQLELNQTKDTIHQIELNEEAYNNTFESINFITLTSLANDMLIQEDFQVRIIYPVGENELEDVSFRISNIIQNNYNDSDVNIYSLGSYRTLIANTFGGNYDNIGKIFFLSNNSLPFQDAFINNILNNSDIVVQKKHINEISNISYDSSDDIIIWFCDETD